METLDHKYTVDTGRYATILKIKTLFWELNNLNKGYAISQFEGDNDKLVLIKNNIIEEILKQKEILDNNN